MHAALREQPRSRQQRERTLVGRDSQLVRKRGDAILNCGANESSSDTHSNALRCETSFPNHLQPDSRSEVTNAQQGARANVHICHVSCLRRSRASCGRRSSLTFGKKVAKRSKNFFREACARSSPEMTTLRKQTSAEPLTALAGACSR